MYDKLFYYSAIGFVGLLIFTFLCICCAQCCCNNKPRQKNANKVIDIRIDRPKQIRNRTGIHDEVTQNITYIEDSDDDGGYYKRRKGYY